MLFFNNCDHELIEIRKVLGKMEAESFHKPDRELQMIEFRYKLAKIWDPKADEKYLIELGELVSK